MKETVPIPHVELFAIPDIPLVQAGNDIADLICEAAKNSRFRFLDQDIVVIAHKIVSKAEGRTVHLSEITPSPEALALANRTGRDPRHCQVILNESKRILYTNGPAILTEHKLGFVNTSSGVDRSNSGSEKGNIVVMLPVDPDKSARKIRNGIKRSTGKEVAVIINDSMGRPWRKGSVGMAIGLAGISAIHSPDTVDISGRVIYPEIAQVDEIAASGSMLMGQGDGRLPVVIVRGIKYENDEVPRVQDLLRPAEEDQVWE